MLPQLFSSFSQLMIAQDDLVPVRLPPGVADVQPAWSGIVERLDDELVEVEALDKLHRLTPVVERGEQDVRCLAPGMLRAPHSADSVVDPPRAVAGSDVDSAEMMAHRLEDVLTECAQCLYLFLARRVVEASGRCLSRPRELYQTEVRCQIKLVG